jgi:hypothetical protein
MLKEFEIQQQSPGEKLRKNFCDSYYDIYVWYEPKGAICDFQLCYGTLSNQYMLEWHEDTGFKHSTVDKCKADLAVKKNLVVSPDHPFPYKEVIDGFLDSLKGSDKAILDDLLFVYDKMIEYTNSGGELV